MLSHPAFLPPWNLRLLTQDSLEASTQTLNCHQTSEGRGCCLAHPWEPLFAF